MPRRIFTLLVATTLLWMPTFAVAHAQEERDYDIGYAVMGFDHPLFQAMMDGADRAANDLGITLEKVDAQFDVSRQNAQIEDFIAKGVDALLVNPVTATETVPFLEEARNAGIPVIAIDTRPVGFDPDAFITMNHFQGGYILGWRVASDLQCEGVWSVIWAVGNEQAASRLRGFETGLSEACEVKGMEYRFEREGDYSGITGPLRETSREITDTLLTRYPEGELSFIFGQTDEFANGAYLATQAAGREDVLIYGMDNNDDMREFLREGRNMIATTAHLPVEVGMASVQTAVDILEGKPFLEEVQLNFQLVDQANVALDPGWGGQYQPSFSSFFFPEQLEVLASAGATTPGDDAAALADEPAPVEEATGLGALTIGLIVAVVVLAALLAWALITRRGKPEEIPRGLVRQ